MMELQNNGYVSSNMNTMNDESLMLNLTPVAPEQTGKGLPYAPENWPEEGDIWGWRTGKRVSVTTGFFNDRYLYPPTRLGRPLRSRPGFPSKLSVERYIKDNFPHLDLNHFFASFSWKIPALLNGNEESIATVPIKKFKQQSESSVSVVCKAGNQCCSSLNFGKEKYPSSMPCDICCVEPGFCGDCCCILCCKTIDSAYDDYSYIKCEVKFGEDICGHIAHMECALRARMAGTVGGSIGLDAEYYCRRCDGRTDLISHVNKVAKICESIDLDYDIEEKILHLGICLLRDSQKAGAKELVRHLELSISKLKCEGETVPEDGNDDSYSPTPQSAGFSDNSDAANNVTANERTDVRTRIESFGALSDSLKLEVEVDEVLKALRKSQQFEYNLAEERLIAHKNYLQNLYKQLEYEESESASKKHSSRSVAVISERKVQIRKEVMKFEDMKRVANGFGKTSKENLKDNFGLEISD
ncbi:unnamed protein product [Lupinus luteus]|uniref:Oberon PHD finger domain-containing protein n=1 Tax=Lupinus luteus TaxID=3873 RepID=A0AAV1XXC9_LUPLU